ncbi:hypothetical protein [Actinomyces qiguomingii]|uniref:hypothetical protein n=1 Tax=Actinomyces qiguomingii TaxID=2057800 RepID=UPI000CA0263D|nr:hypothetical protein [Actinomyces qiguomingii]
MTPPTPLPGPSGLSPTAPEPLGARAIATAVLAAVLTFSLIVGGALALARGKNYAALAEPNQLAITGPSSEWTNGAERTWTTTVAANAQVMTVPGHLLTLDTGDDPAASTLTAYDLTDSGVTESWSATVDATNDSGDTSDDFDIPMKPAYLLWGNNTLIHDTTLYDLDTGETREAKWSSSDGVLIADDIAIACTSENKCTGYQEDAPDTPLWTTSTDYAADYLRAQSAHYATVFPHGDQRYCNISYREIYNIDTGEKVQLNLPLSPDNIRSYAAYGASDGWFIVLTDTSDRSVVYTYDLDGGEPTDSYDEQFDTPRYSWVVPVFGSLSLAEFRTRFADNSLDTVLGIVNADEDRCAKSVDITYGRTIELPNSADGPSCLSAIRIAADRSVMTAGPRVTDSQDIQTFRLMYNADTGEQITFPGMDPDSGALFDLVATDYAIGYDPPTGTLTGYRPAS